MPGKALTRPARQAAEWAEQHALRPASADPRKVWLLLVDMQNTFCLPDHELFVAGRSGRGAVEDTIRLCQFIYSNLGNISRITATMDTHTTMQIFHAIFLVDASGEHPQPYSQVNTEAVRSGQWKFNPALAGQLGISPEYGQAMLLHYVSELERRGKYALTIWPYHAMLGGIGHASFRPSKMLFFTDRTPFPDRSSWKGRHLHENYSVIGPEVLTGPMGECPANTIRALKRCRRMAHHRRPAKSHASNGRSQTRWDIQARMPARQKDIPARGLHSPVVVPGADYTRQRISFQDSGGGMHVVKSTDPIESWEGFPGLELA
jgi:nicotinamidase-related amidase